MPAAQILHTIAKFYTTEVQLKAPNTENDWANYALSYLQHFTGKDVIKSQDGKIERVNPKTVKEKFPWIPSALKSVAYFFLTVPFTVIGTIARVLSLDSTEVTEAIFSEKCPPPRRQPTQSPKNDLPRLHLSSSRKGRNIYRLPQTAKPNDAGLSSASSSEQKTSNTAWNALLQSGKGLKGEAAASYQEMQAMGPEKYKLQKQEEASQMLGLLLSFYEELLKHAQKGTSTPNYAAVATFIEEQRNTPNYCFPFFLRDYFMMSLPTLTMLGIKLDPQNSARWEELDVQCQVIMYAPELKAYLNEESPNELQNLLTANQGVIRSQALPLKAQIQDIMKKHSEFFQQLLAQLGKKPMNRSEILSLVNAQEDKIPIGVQAFTCARLYKAESRVVKNFYDESLFSSYIQLYTSCLVQLHHAKFTIPSTDKPLSKDLEETEPVMPAPTPSTPAADPKIATDSQINAVPFTILLQSAISFSEELLKQKSVDAQKVFLENNRKATATYKSAFNTRCYVILALRTFIETKASLNPTDVNRWRKLDEKLEIVMQNPTLKPYLEEDEPEFKSTNAAMLEQIRIALVRNQPLSEQNFRENTLFFQLLLSMLAQTPLQRNIIEVSLRAEQDRVAAVFFEAKGLLAARAFTKDLFVGELYENYFNAYIACITRLQTLNFEIPFFSMNSPQAEPIKAAPAPSTPALPAAQIARINQELKAVTDFNEELLAISPDGTSDWLEAQKLKPGYCYPFHWSTTNAETLKNHRALFDQALMKKWEKLHPKCVTRLEEKNLKSHLDETPETPADCKQS